MSRIFVLVVLSFVSCLLASCVSPYLTKTPGAASLRDGPVYVSFEIDKADLKGVLAAILDEEGIHVASDREHARFEWTGTYSADWDLIHYRFTVARFVVTDLARGSTVALANCDQSGWTSVETILREMVLGLVSDTADAARHPRPTEDA